MRNLRHLFYVSAVSALLLCVNGTAYATDNMVETPECSQLNSSQQSKEQFIKNLYSKYVFGSEDFAPVARKYCTQRMRKILSDAYDYDCYDNECYAVWMFRSGVQDGPSNVCKVTNIMKQSNGWYLVNFIDMGNGGSVRIKFVDINGSFKIDDLDNPNLMY